MHMKLHTAVFPVLAGLDQLQHNQSELVQYRIAAVVPFKAANYLVCISGSEASWRRCRIS